MSDARQAILTRLRHATSGEGPPLPALSPRPQPADRLVEQFAAELRAVAGTCRHGGTLDTLAGAVASTLPGPAGGTAVHWNTPLLNQLLDTPLLRDGRTWLAAPDAAADAADHAAWRAAAAAATAGLTEADYALADTGTLVLLAAPGQARLASLLPPVHLAVLSAARILPHLDALFTRLGPDRARLTPCLTFVTGPSRTADIEKKLVLGAHGPKQLHVIVYD